jgi:Concanavalin A-like lectin/glucanases superfamily
MPFAIGGVAAGIDIEPFTTIKSFNPLCYWRMDEASGSLVNSGSAASKNATVTNLTYNQTKIATRSPKGSVNFNGTTNTAEVAAGVIGGASPTFSIGCFIRTTTSAGNAALICQNDGTNGNSGFLFKINSGAYLSFQGITTGGVNDFSFLSEQIADINDGNNHYVGATVTADNVYVYIDGAMVGTPAGRLGGTWSATPKIFLGQISGATQRYAGNMSDAFITSQVLTQADHNRIWRAGMLHSATPANDNFLDAVEIPFPTTETTLTSFSVANNTIEPGEIIIDSGKTAWYKIVSPTAGKRIKLQGDGQNPLFSYHYLEVFEDTDGTIAGLQPVSSSLGYLTTAYKITEANKTYYVRIRPKDFYPNVLDLTYSYVTPPAAPANDNFANATLIDVTSAGSIAGTTDGASIEFSNETDYWDTGLYTSVWYKFVAGATGNITLTDTSGNDSIIVLFEDVADVTELETIVNGVGAYDGDSPALTTAVTSGSTYHIQISDYANGQPFTLAWTTIT